MAREFNFHFLVGQNTMKSTEILFIKKNDLLVGQKVYTPAWTKIFVTKIASTSTVS